MREDVKLDSELLDRLRVLSETDKIDLEDLIEIAIINLLTAKGM